MSWYRASTISLTNGSTAVTGAATDFIANSAVGEGLLAPDGKVYEIAAIVSATALTLGSAYLGSTASGQSYAIIPSQSYLRDLALQAATLVNDYQSVLDSAGAGKFGDGTLGSPGIQFASDSNTGLRRTGTDAVALVTGGVDRITVDAAGAVAVASSLSVAGSAVPTLTSTATLTNKTLALSSNTISGTLAQFNTALTDGDFATLAGTETLTNKTLTNPSYSGATANGGTVTTIDINGGTIDGTVIGGSSASAGSFTTLSTSSTPTFNTNVGYIGASGSGLGGNWRYKDDTGTSRWLAGILGSLGATNWTLYDIVNAKSALTVAPNPVEVQITTTGLTVTGTLSATGVGSVGGAAAALNAFTINQASTYAETITNGSQAYAWRLDGTSLKLSDRTAFTEKLEVSSTGLAVTGALSASGGISTSAGVLTVTSTAASGTVATLKGSTGFGLTFTSDAVGPPYTQLISAGGGEEIALGISGVPYATVSPTGLAVTGALSATGKITQSGTAGYEINNGSVLGEFKYSGGLVINRVSGSSLIISQNGNTEAIFDTSGNLGLGVTPSGTEKALIFPDTLSIKVALNGQVTGNYYAIEKRAAVSGGDGAFKFVAGNTAAGEFVFSSGGNNKAVLDASGNLTVAGGITTGSYTVATRPAHAAGRIIHVTDGGAGAVFQGSAGGSWVNLG